MSFALRRTTPADFDELVELFRVAMDVSPAAPFLGRAHMAWKYWDEHPWWQGSRGYVIEKNGEIAAHGGAWPVYLRRNGETLPGLNLIDWAALDRFPGSGLVLVKRLLRELPRMYNIGGSDDTNEVLPRFGFETTNQHHLAAKPLRPLRQAWTHQRRDWKLPARLVHNLAWSRSGAARPPGGWDAVRVANPDAAPAHWWADEDPAGMQVLRTAEWYRYILASPATPFELYDLRCQGQSRGFFCLSRCPGQARLADYRIAGEQTAAAWTALAALALQQARRDAPSAEMTVWTSHEAFLAALEGSGFRKLRSDAVRCNRAEFEAAAGAPHFFTALDSDFAYLHADGFDYAT